MRSDLFRPNGQYDAYIDGAVLVATVSGNWNIEMHQESRRRSAPLVAELESRGPWGCLVVVTDSLVSSLEVLKAGRQAVEASRGVSQLKALAWVISPEIEGYSLLAPVYRGLYASLVETEVFTSLQEARAWMRRHVPEGE